MRFDWDQAKNRTNIRDHGIDFEDAVAVFAGPIFERLDDRRDYGEERWLAVGLMYGIEITVIYADQATAEGPVRQVISARRAIHHEREAFYRDQEGR